MREALLDAGAERAVIGAAMTLEAADPVFRTLPAHQFADADHRALWAAILALATEGIDPMPEAVKARLRGLNGAGESAVALVDDLEARYAFEPATYHADVVRDRAIRRSLVDVASDIAGRAADLSLSVSELADYAERRVFAVAERQTATRPQAVKAYLMPVLGLIESGGHKGAATGYTDLDRALTGGGFLPGQLIGIAGATSMGKTALALGIAANQSISGQAPVLYLSIEMTEPQNTLRLLAMEARADLKALAEGRTNDYDLANLSQAASHLNVAPLLLHSGARTLAAIRAETRRLKAEHPEMATVFVDHIHDMAHPADSRREQLGAIARGLKDMAMELDIAVVAVAQLRRIGERTDPRPRLDDLKESGDIENSMDVAMLLHRPEYYLSDDQAREQGVVGQAEAIIAKQRNGPTPTIKLTWIRHCARFDSYQGE